ncbi:MAG: sigma-70 family RNA polymerase sigma factor [Clostridiales bacterium]|nr:sigma-70 family RNA polymerase sigma factor [Clostridiales bacterium]
MEDALIVDLYWDRDERAISETQIKYERYLTKIAMNVLSDREDSLEAVNDTYLHAWNSMPPHRPEILSTFLGKITRRVSIDSLRKKTAVKRGGSEYEVSLQELSENGIEPGTMQENESEYQDMGRYISEYLRTLPEDMRNVFISRYFHFDPLKDICKNFGFSESKVKSILFRVRNGLKDHLKKAGYEL